MPSREYSGKHGQMRIRIAQLAAQLMAEHGIRDYQLAKRKAARQLGAPDSHSLPGNDEIDAALKAYHALYLPQVHDDHIGQLRRQALVVMRILERFDPVLVGGVANGTATLHADIEIEVLADSSKEFEQYLHNQNIPFKVKDRAGLPAYLLYGDPADVWIRLLPSRHHPSMARPRGDLQRLGTDQLAALLGEPGSAHVAV